MFDTQNRREVALRPEFWFAFLSLASVVFSASLACATPFAALAALAALTLPRRSALALIALAWATNQAIGFCALDYPVDSASLGWGAAIGLAALAALGAGMLSRSAIGHRPLAHMALALITAIAAFETVLYGATAVLPSSAEAFAWPVIGRVVLINAAAFVLLALTRHLASRVGARGLRRIALPAKPTGPIAA